MNDKEIIAGKNPVMEALKSGRSINKLMVQREKTGDMKEAIKLAASRKVPVLKVDRKKLDGLTNEKHQGILAIAAAKNYIDFEKLLTKCTAVENPFLVLLDGLQDPRNFGAILRTAEAAGCHGVVIPLRRNVPLNDTVAKTSSGAVEYVPVSRVTNLARTIETLKEKGFWVIGCDAAGDELIYNVDLKIPLAIVIGGEGKGLSRLNREKCDLTVRLPMKGRLNSLNASVAASIAMYEVLRQREYK